ncbi:unnamed protein product [Alopecurus aequalis]
MASEATAAARVTRRRQDDDGRLSEVINDRRSRLLDDAREVSELFAPHLAVLVYPAAGKANLFANPTVESVLRSFLAPDEDYGTEKVEEAAARVAAVRREARSIEAQVAQEQARLRAVAEKVKGAQGEQGRDHWWEVDVDALGEAELPEFATALEVLKADVLRRIDNLAKAPKPPQRQ